MMVSIFFHVVFVIWIAALQWQVNLLKGEANISTNDILDEYKDEALEKLEDAKEAVKAKARKRKG